MHNGSGNDTALTARNTGSDSSEWWLSHAGHPAPEGRNIQLMNLQRKNIQDKRVIELIKKYLKAGVMENGFLVRTTEGSPQGGPLSPLLQYLPE